MIEDYLNEVRYLLNVNHIEDTKAIMEYLEEMIFDRRENGESEEEIVNSLETPQEMLNTLLKEGMKIKENKDAGNRQSFADVSVLNIELTSSDIVFNVSEDENLYVQWEGDIVIKQKGETLEIHETYQRNNIPLFRIFRSSDLCIFVPRNKDFQLDVSVLSGDISLCDLVIDHCRISSTSGDITIRSSCFSSLRLHATSGDFDLKDIECEQLQVDATSGDIDLIHPHAESMTLNSVSGDIDLCLNGKREDYSISVNGPMKSFHDIVDGKYEINISTISGDVNYSFD